MKRNQKKRSQSKIFSRLFITSALTIVTTVIVLVVTITNYYSDIIIQKELNINTRTLERIEDYISSKEAEINRAKRDLYVRGDMLDDITYALQNGYEKYLNYRLDKFAGSPSFMPSNIDTYFNGYFSQDPDINGISLRSLENRSIEYLLIYNYIRWNESMSPKRKDPLGDTLFADPGVLPPNRQYKNTLIKEFYINNPVTLKKIGMVSVYYSTERLEKMVKRHEGTPASFFLANSDGKIVYSLNRGIPAEIIKQAKQETNEKKVTYKRENYYINTIANKGDYTYISIIPDKALKKLSIVRGTMWLFIILFLAASLLVIYSFIRNYSKRINMIVSTIRQVEGGNLQARVPETKHEDELSKIGTNINTMLAELNDYIEKFYLSNIKQQQAELRALQAQIDPHFLFNTLEAIRMVAVVDGSKTSSEMIFHLAKLFRYSMESKDVVPLCTEVEYVNQYLILMQYKFPDKLKVSIDIDSEAEQLLVPKLILQPIIENYFVHGFRKHQKDNHLILEAKVTECLEITVNDNGTGITEERLACIQDHINSEEGDEVRSIGLRNIHQRLRLKYGKQFGLTIAGNENMGATVTLRMPGREDKNV